METRATEITPDSEHGGFIALLPVTVRPYALLARLDRPIGWWLLFGPCAWGLLLAGGARTHWPLLAWMLIGSVAMRGAGCAYNDIVDRKLDAQVERTRLRPIASGAVPVKNAWVWLLMLCGIGLVVLLQLPMPAQIAALAILLPVAAYPFMKRITWWPQAWLGIVFTWGAPVGWIAVRGEVEAPLVALYFGSMCWCIAYDTIYALQDREDDALVGVRSSALRMGSKVKGGVMGFYAAAITLWAVAFWLERPQLLALLALIPVACQLLWQALSLNPDDGGDALDKFRSNRTTGLLMALACLVVGF